VLCDTVASGNSGKGAAVFRKKKDILMHGVSARATVIRVEDTGVYVNGNPRVKLTVQVPGP
jgi:hypothetical protein